MNNLHASYDQCLEEDRLTVGSGTTRYGNYIVLLGRQHRYNNPSTQLCCIGKLQTNHKYICRELFVNPVEIGVNEGAK